MLVGDLSAKSGGYLAGHNSHQTGRDADVGFYVMNSKGKPAKAKHFVSFDSKGQGRELEWAHFDEARNWTLVEALLKDEKLGVRYLFVMQSAPSAAPLLRGEEARIEGAHERAATVMMSPQDADLHDNHFHIRMSCPESMRERCIEESAPRAGASETAAGVVETNTTAKDDIGAVAPSSSSP